MDQLLTVSFAWRRVAAAPAVPAGDTFIAGAMHCLLFLGIDAHRRTNAC